MLETTYTDSDLGQLLTVSMTWGGAQTRTWAYDAVKRERLVSVTHPEIGTTLFSYNNDGTVAEETDAKMQKLVKRLLAGGGEDARQRVWHCYDTHMFAAGFTENANGRFGGAGDGAGRTAPPDAVGWGNPIIPVPPEFVRVCP